jgi:putative membrane protein
MTTPLLAAAIGLTLIAGSVRMQEPGAAATRPPSAKTGPGQQPLSAADRTFVTKAAEGGKAEVELAQLAQQKATSENVKALARRIAEDHQQASRDLEAIAGQKNIPLPDAMSAEHSALKTKLEAASGSDFDQQYVAAMIKDHKKDIAEFQHTASHASDADIKAFASKTLPTLQEHLRQAEAAARK